jgi:hypothetical protein
LPANGATGAPAAVQRCSRHTWGPSVVPYLPRASRTTLVAGVTDVVVTLQSPRPSRRAAVAPFTSSWSGSSRTPTPAIEWMRSGRPHCRHCSILINFSLSRDTDTRGVLRTPPRCGCRWVSDLKTQGVAGCRFAGQSGCRSRHPWVSFGCRRWVSATPAATPCFTALRTPPKEPPGSRRPASCGRPGTPVRPV